MAPSAVVTEALARFKLAVEADTDQRQREIDDLKFQVPEHQWPDDVQKQRNAMQLGNVTIPARPMLSIATLDEPIQLVLNQEKSAHLGVKIHPLTEDATDETAEVLQGLYRTIERDSRAGLARSWAYDRAVKCGRGAYRILKAPDPEGGHPFDQKIVIKRLLHQTAAYFDPFAEEPDWSDGEWAFVTQDMRWTTFKRLYPKSALTKGYDDGDLTGLGNDHPGWIGGDDEASRTVRIAEYWRLEITPVTYVLLDDGTVADRTKIPEGRLEVTGDTAREVTIEERRVLWSKINCHEELEPSIEWDGKYIPLVPVIGRELQPFDNERRWVGMIHNAKDGARLTNYAASGAVEMAALEPKAPWQGVEGVFEGHEEEYRQSNIRNIPFLQHKPIDLNGNPAPAPQRVQVDVSRMGPSMQLLSMGRDFVQMATQTYDPALGKQSPAHRSGRALVALQDQTVVATSNYLSNLADIAMTYESMVILDLIPHVYDRPGRVARILDEQNVVSSVMLNQAFTVDPNTKRPVAAPDQPDPQQASDDQRTPVKFYDLTKGRYGVSVTIGKSNTSRLMEGNDSITRMLEAAPEMWPVVGPTWAKFQDFPGAQAIATDLKKMRDHAMPWMAESEQPDAAQQLEQAKQQLQVQGQQLQQAAEMIKTEQVKEAAKVEIEKAKEAAKVELEKLKGSLAIELQRMKNAAQLTIEQMKLEADGIRHATEMRNEAIALGVQSAEASKDRAHDAGLSAQGHRQTMTENDQTFGQSLAQAEQGQDHALEQGQQAADLAPEPESEGDEA